MQSKFKNNKEKFYLKLMNMAKIKRKTLERQIKTIPNSLKMYYIPQ